MKNILKLCMLCATLTMFTTTTEAFAKGAVGRAGGARSVAAKPVSHKPVINKGVNKPVSQKQSNADDNIHRTVVVPIRSSSDDDEDKKNKK